MNRISQRIPLFVVPGIMMILGATPLPYGYYTLLRLVVTVASGILCYAYFTNGSKLFIVLGIVSLLFNPIIPIHLDKALWAILDLIIGLLFVGLGVREHRKDNDF